MLLGSLYGVRMGECDRWIECFADGIDLLGYGAAAYSRC